MHAPGGSRPHPECDDALTIETCRECPCCGARLWVSIPSVAEILETAANYGCPVPDLEAALTRRERQVLNLLHHSPYALRHGQLAALVWSESTRTHDVRSVLFRLRRKLQATGWTIPFPPRGQGVRLIREAPLNRPGDPDSSRQEPGEVSTTLPPFATWRSSSAAPLR